MFLLVLQILLMQFPFIRLVLQLVRLVQRLAERKHEQETPGPAAAVPGPFRHAFRFLGGEPRALEVGQAPDREAIHDLDRGGAAAAVLVDDVGDQLGRVSRAAATTRSISASTGSE